MQTPEQSDDNFSNLAFYGTFEDLQAMREAETPYTQTRIISKPDETGEPGESDYSITTKHGPRKQLILQIHEEKAVEQLLSTETQFIYSFERELKTTIAYVNLGQTIQVIKNTNPYFTCFDVNNNNFGLDKGPLKRTQNVQLRTAKLFLSARALNKLKTNNIKVTLVLDHNNTQLMFYQCEDCEKFFSRISEFRKHLVEVVARICNSCGKFFLNHEKYLLHCLGHGDPDRECSDCRKVLANRYSLKKHRSICKKRLNRKSRKYCKPPKTASN